MGTTGNTGEGRLVHARERLDAWMEAWVRTGTFVLLLDFDGTLAPIVDRPEDAAMPERTRAALRRLLGAPGLRAAVISGRGMADARERVGMEAIPYAGNHGMEIEGPGIREVQEDAAAARPVLEEIAGEVERALAEVEGAIVEDKGLTLSIHYRRVAPAEVGRVQEAVRSAVGNRDRVRLTEGKMVLEVRPAVDWHKGRAAEFLLREIDPPAGSPIVYLGDDTTDEDAFHVLNEREMGEGVIVADPPPATTVARSYLRSPAEVGELLEAMADRAPSGE